MEVVQIAPANLSMVGRLGRLRSYQIILRWVASCSINNCLNTSDWFCGHDLHRSLKILLFTVCRV